MFRKKWQLASLFQLDEPIVSKFDTNIKAIDINKKDDPILSMIPKRVTHVRICQRLLVIAQQPQRTSIQEDQHLVKMTNPVKA